MTTAELLTKLKLTVRDTTNTKWTEPEMQEAIDEALVDPIFCDIVESNLTVNTTTQDYTIPTTIDVVEDVYANIDGTEKITGDKWEQIGSTIRFRQFPPDAGTYVLTGFKQVTDIPNEMSNMALYLSTLKLYEMLDHKFATGLLMSDITGAEIMNRLDYYNRKAEGERRKVGRITNRRGYAI